MTAETLDQKITRLLGISTSGAVITELEALSKEDLRAMHTALQNSRDNARMHLFALVGLAIVGKNN